jgi:hypothetical protein
VFSRLGALFIVENLVVEQVKSQDFNKISEQKV